MENLAEFLRMFLSYGIVLIICVSLMCVGAIIGIKMRQSKNNKELVNAESTENEN